MDIPALSMAMSQQQVSNNISTALMGMAIEKMQSGGEDLTKMLEASVSPHLGQNIDISV